jgi:chaperonin GroES
MTIKPLADRVVTKTLEAEEKTKSGIILSSASKEKPQYAEVVSVGPGGKDEKGNSVTMTVKPGDKVLISKYSGTEVKLDDVDYTIVKQSDILAVVIDESIPNVATFEQVHSLDGTFLPKEDFEPRDLKHEEEELKKAGKL